MPTVTFIFGYCGAGKTHAADELASKGIEKLDEDPTFTCPADGSLSPEKYAKLQELLKAGKDCAVVEATLFYEPLRRQALKYVEGIQGVQVAWIGFEKDLDAANHNCLHRKNKGDGLGHKNVNANLARAPYTFPDGAEIRPIHRIPEPDATPSEPK